MISNPFKDVIGWHLAQNIYSLDSEIRALKAGGGSGNIPKVLIEYE